MAQTTWTETVCDRCGIMEREQGVNQSKPSGLLSGWSYLNRQGQSLDAKVRTSILCPDCGDALHEFLVFDTDKAAT